MYSMKYLQELLVHFIVALSLCITTIQAQNFNKLEASIQDLMEEHKVPGVTYAIIEKSEVVGVSALGLSNSQSKKKLDLHNTFNIGSVSKIFTAWGIMTLVEDGFLSLSDPIMKHTGAWELPSAGFNLDEITIAHLLQHTAGLNVHGYAGYDDPDQRPSLIDCLSGSARKKERVEVVMSPGSKFQYSGGGYTILQMIIENVSGKKFALYMEEEIFLPLGMTSTSFAIDDKTLEISAAAHGEDGSVIPLRRFTAMAAAGLQTSIDDMVKFAKAHWEKNEVISMASLQKLLLPSEVSGRNYAKGYMVMERFGVFTLNGHGGSNEGWESGIMLDVKNKSAYIMLTNSSNGKAVVLGSLKRWTMERRQSMKDSD